MVLVAPISYVPAESPTPDAVVAAVSDEKASQEEPSIIDPAELSNIGVAIISASRIKFMTVTNVQPGAADEFNPASDSRALVDEVGGGVVEVGEHGLSDVRVER